MPRSSRNKGQIGEDAAANFLKNYLSYTIVDRNYKRAEGEVDIIAKDAEFLVFVEVKTDFAHHSGRPLEWITEDKEDRLRATAEYYLMENELADVKVRFDIITLEKSGEFFKVDHLKGVLNY